MVEAKLLKIAFHTGLYKSADISHDCKRALRFKKKKKKTLEIGNGRKQIHETFMANCHQHREGPSEFRL